ncbi:YtcA family lipoprotein [Martelella soudanensis]|uniref:YtcA family lipoprotein n=1 Tax=unclassified Martelella TaxID=2629616 RepID=UPI001FEEBD21|nr:MULTISPECIES: YtcA family lipoprotein [unclassified Martelella]
MIPFFGAYFPSWIACSLIGIFGSIIVRLVFIKVGLDDVMPVRVIVYLFLAIAIGLASSLILFGR